MLIGWTRSTFTCLQVKRCGLASQVITLRLLHTDTKEIEKCAWCVSQPIRT
ncbi:hypothetical protein [Enterobacter phage N5822]|nr:hypothetical protein [Enterobacter phage N5822]QPD96257.1 hypothetical protein [Enterobacter phage N5822]